MASEIEAYVDEAYNKLHARKMNDVMVTDHSPKDKKYHTTSGEED